MFRCEGKPRMLSYILCNILGLPGGFARNFNIFWGGVGWGGDDTVPCNCTHLGATQLMFLSCTCTHLDATQLMFLALAHISMLCN